MLSQNLFLGVSALFGLAQGAILLEERGANGCNADNVLRALRRFSTDAVPFCSSYIQIPVVSITVTGAATSTETATTTIPTTVVATSTEVTVVDVTTTVSAPQITIAPRDVIFGQIATFAARDAQLPSYVSQYPASRVSSACSCLSVIPSTTIISTTTTSIESTTLSVTSTETDTVTTTTTSVNAVATVTPNNRCGVGYNVAGNGIGNSVLSVGATGPADCCAQCQLANNCVASAFSGTNCQLLTRSSTIGSVQVTNQCPLGTTSYNFGSPTPGGIVYAGPCAAM